MLRGSGQVRERGVEVAVAGLQAQLVEGVRRRADLYAPVGEAAGVLVQLLPACGVRCGLDQVGAAAPVAGDVDAEPM